jgi:hypothetical protein
MIINLSKERNQAKSLALDQNATFEDNAKDITEDEQVETNNRRKD